MNFALPGFMPHKTPVADAQNLASSDGGWRIEIPWVKASPVAALERWGIADKVEFRIEQPRLESILRRDEGSFLVLEVGTEIPALLALRGDNRFRLVSIYGSFYEFVIRQTKTVTPSLPEGS